MDFPLQRGLPVRQDQLGHILGYFTARQHILGHQHYPVSNPQLSLLDIPLRLLLPAKRPQLRMLH